jgi:hypothetical protein
MILNIIGTAIKVKDSKAKKETTRAPIKQGKTLGDYSP